MTRRPFVVPVASLRRHLGAEDHVEVIAPIAELRITGSHVPLGASTRTAAVLRSIEGGVEVRGTVSAPWQGECRRCAKPVEGQLSAELREIFTPDSDGETTYPLEGDTVDLEPVAHDVILLNLPDIPLCKADCAGLCPACGIDLNEETCSCEVDLKDPRWAALEALRTTD